MTLHRGAGRMALALVLIALAGGCRRGDDRVALLPRPSSVPASAGAADSSPTQRTSMAPTRPGATPTATPSTVYLAGVGWDVTPFVRDYGVGVPFAAVGLACARALPPGATVIVRVTGSAGARPALDREVGADGSVVVPFGLLHAGEVVWEFQSITLRDGTSFGALPRGRSGMVGSTDEPCVPS